MNDKDKWGIKQYIGIGLTAISVIAAAIILFFVIYRFEQVGKFFEELFSVLQPIIFGFVIAYLLNPLVRKTEFVIDKINDFSNKQRKKRNKKEAQVSRKLKRSTAIVSALLIACVIAYILLNMVVPEIVVSLSNMINDLPAQSSAFIAKLDHFVQNNQLMSKVDSGYIQLAREKINEFLRENISPKIENIMQYFAIGVKGIFNVFNVLLNFIIGIIVSVYVLWSKEVFTGQVKKLLYAVTNKKAANVIIDTVRHMDKIFGGFISGKLVDSMIIGVLCFIGMSILRLPYALLISVIVGVTNIIPFFGPYIGAIPSIFLILLVNPIQSLYFAIFVLILQQIDGNIIGPKILGDSTGLSPFWVMFSIIVGGGLLGFVGMIIGVPLCAVIFYIVNKIVDSLLVKKELPMMSEEYRMIKSIENDRIKYMDEKKSIKKENKNG